MSSGSTTLRDSWLREKCGQVLARSNENSGITAGELAGSILSTLLDNKTDAEIQDTLFEALHFDFDAVAEILQNRSLIVARSNAILADCSGNSSNSGHQSGAGSSRGRGRGRSRRRRGPSLGNDLNYQESQHNLGGSVADEFEMAFPGVGYGDRLGIGGIDRVGLPAGTERSLGNGFEEFYIPPPEPTSNVTTEELITVSDALKDYPEFIRAMHGVSTFNRLQSTVFPVAYKTGENMLVCAPTGAGKTNVALLTVFQQMKAARSSAQKNFKIVYVAPMKALAAEVVAKFGKRLGPLGLKVREYTGDMRLSYKEANETDILVTTPEKWDVVTRKSSSSLSSSITLLILDEVHLLYDDRGAVVESIVARTRRFSETARKQIRLVGLSATLPNYKDVAAFLNVEEDKGLFHFGPGYRPVPLSQTFIGVTAGEHGAPREAMMKKKAKLSELAWLKVKDALVRGHQAMVFVHSRKATASSARELLDEAAQDGGVSIFLPKQLNEDYTGKHDEELVPGLPNWALEAISKARSTDVRELCPKGIGIHNAGMQRSDRNLVEKLFAEGAIRVLCCTATLAWGVNLPARAVIIKGTEVYNADKGKFEQIGMLDVQQIFGRAGRPQFDTQGEATIITMHEHLANYLNMLVKSVPIESTLGSSPSKLADHLNAEIVSGTVTSVGEAVKWLSYTFLSVRMPINPLVYGFEWKDVQADPHLHSQRAELLKQASMALDDAKMCRYDPRTGSLTCTELGRVCSYSYVSHRTLVLWNEILDTIDPYDEYAEQDDTHMDILYSTVIEAVSRASEFEQMRSRNEELRELEYLRKNSCPIELKSPPETREGKVSILLQAHISRANIRMSDLSYIVQSSTRLLRALFEISLIRGLQGLTLAALELARASDSRIWPFQHPLLQFSYGSRKGRGLTLRAEIIANLESLNEDGKISVLKCKTNEELSEYIRVPAMVRTLRKAMSAIPVMTIANVNVGPVTRTLLEFRVTLCPDFKWNDEAHGNFESWWFWIEDRAEGRIYHSEKISLNKAQVQKFTEPPNSNSGNNTNQQLQSSTFSGGINLTILVPVFDPPSEKYWVRVESEYWHTGTTTSKVVNISAMQLPVKSSPKTKMLDLRPLPISKSLPANMVEAFDDSFTHFYPVQVQLFDALYSSDSNMFAAVPLGSGKTTLAELALFQPFSSPNQSPHKCVLYLAPLKRVAHRRYQDWKRRIGSLVFSRIIYLEDVDFSSTRLPNLDDALVVSTPNSWNAFTFGWSPEQIVQSVSTVVVDDIHLVASQNGHELEVAVAKLRKASEAGTDARIRFVGLSAPVSNPMEIANWLGVLSENCVFNFDFSSRIVKCTTDCYGVADEKYVHRMQAMMKPVFLSLLKGTSPTGMNGIVFTSSSREAFFTANDLLRFAELDNKPDQFVGSGAADSSNLTIARNVSNSTIRSLVHRGIGVCNSEMLERDREAVEALFKNKFITVVIMTFDDAWDSCLRSSLIIIKGTESFSSYQERYVDLNPAQILQMVGKAGRPNIDLKCHALILTEERKKPLLKKFLNDSLPIESQLQENFIDHMVGLVAAGQIQTLEDVIEFLSWSLFIHRICSNPSYYGVRGHHNATGNVVITPAHVRSFCSKFAKKCIDNAWEFGCLKASEDVKTVVGQVPKRFELSALGSIFVNNKINSKTGKLMTMKLLENRNRIDVTNLICECVATEEIAMNLTEQLTDQIVDSLPEWYLNANTGKKDRRQALDKLGIMGLTGSLEGRLRVVYHGHMSGYSSRNNEFREAIKEVLRAMSKYAIGGLMLTKELRITETANKFITVIQSLATGYLKTSAVTNVIDIEDSRDRRDCNSLLKRHGLEQVGTFLKERTRAMKIVGKSSLRREVISQLENLMNANPEIKLANPNIEKYNEGENIEWYANVTVEQTWTSEFGRRTQRQARLGRTGTATSATAMVIVVTDATGGQIESVLSGDLLGGERQRRIRMKLSRRPENEEVKISVYGWHVKAEVLTSC